jgi:phage baseplate assembly protein W
MADPFMTDLRVIFPLSGAPVQESVDLALGPGLVETVSGIENLQQALRLRLMIERGELSGLGHPQYGSRIHALLGEQLDSANRELLRRYVRQALLADPRVAEVSSVTVTAREGLSGAVDVLATVLAVSGAEVPVQVVLNGG